MASNRLCLHALSFLQPIPVPARHRRLGTSSFSHLMRHGPGNITNRCGATLLRATAQEKGQQVRSAQRDAFTQKTTGGTCSARRQTGAELRKKSFQQTVSCEKAQAIVSEYGFKEIKAKVCSGATLHFSATRDGKPFLFK